jgi:DNA-binding CsgD family transcriptional regulator
MENERNKEILKLFKGGMTQTKIAEKYNIGTRRVRVIITRQMTPEGLKKQVQVVLKKKYKKERKEREENKGVAFICKNCGVTFFDKRLKRVYCSNDCFYNYMKRNTISDEERVAKKKEWFRKYYLRRKQQ